MNQNRVKDIEPTSVSVWAICSDAIGTAQLALALPGAAGARSGAFEPAAGLAAAGAFEPADGFAAGLAGGAAGLAGVVAAAGTSVVGLSVAVAVAACASISSSSFLASSR